MLKLFSFLCILLCLFAFPSCSKSDEEIKRKEIIMYKKALDEIDLFMQKGELKKANDEIENIRIFLESKSLKDSLTQIVKANNNLIDSIDKQKRKQIEKIRSEGLKELGNLRIEEDEMRDLKFYYSPLSTKYRDKNYLYSYIVENDYGFTLRLVIQYASSDWLFVDNYLIKADDEKFRYEVDEVERDNSGGKIWEWSDQSVKNNTLEMRMLEKIAISKKVTVRCNGSKYYDDRTLKANEIKGLNQIVEIYKKLTSE